MEGQVCVRNVMWLNILWKNIQFFGPAVMQGMAYTFNEDHFQIQCVNFCQK